MIGSINEFFDVLPAKLDIDPRVLKNKVDVILDDEKYRELKGRVDSRLDDTVIKVDAFLMIVQVLLIRIFRSQNSFFVLMLSLVGRDRRDIGERVFCVAMCCYEFSSADGQFLGRR